MLLVGRDTDPESNTYDLAKLGKPISYQGEHFLQKKHNGLDLESKECVFV